MTRWRLATRDERRTHFRHLSRLLTPRIAATIAAMPIVVSAPEIPWTIRADAWLWRTRRAGRPVVTARPRKGA